MDVDIFPLRFVIGLALFGQVLFISYHAADSLRSTVFLQCFAHGLRWYEAGDKPKLKRHERLWVSVGIHLVLLFELS
jgi:hypothetical protein